MHDVSVAMLEKQAACIGIPLVLFPMEKYPGADAYGEAMRAEMEKFRQEGIEWALFGDLWREDVRTRREQKLAGSGIKAAFPLWGMRPDEVLEEFFAAGFRSVVTNADERLGRGAVGRGLREAVSLLPQGADICGENGEYHSFVYGGPNFSGTVPFSVGKITERAYPDGQGRMRRCYYAELV